MKVNEWFTVRDWVKLTVEEQTNLLRYLQFVGVFVGSYWFESRGKPYSDDELLNECAELDVDASVGYCLFHCHVSKQDPMKQLSLDDLKRIAELANFS